VCHISLQASAEIAMLSCCVLVQRCSYHHMAVALAHLDDADNAVAAYERALSLDPADAYSHTNYGELHKDVFQRRMQHV